MADKVASIDGNDEMNRQQRGNTQQTDIVTSSNDSALEGFYEANEMRCLTNR